MCDLSRILDRKHEPWLILSLFVAGFVPRLLAVVFMLDSGGDGPFRAVIAYSWSQWPYLSTHGFTLPGFMYLSGIFNFFVSDPLISSRILNLIFGTLTVPIFYLLVCRTFDRATALFGAFLLAFLPLHIGLSASSLAEASFLFWLFASLVSLLKATDVARRQTFYLILSLVFACIAVTIRYEAWLLIPLLPFYYYWKSRKGRIAILMAVILAIFPIFWSISNYLHSGDFMPIRSAATTFAVERAGAQQMSVFDAIWNVGSISISHIGLILIITILWGIILQFLHAIRKKITAERVLYVSMFGIFWMFILYLAMARGTALWHRYLLFGFVLALPLAVIPLKHYVANYRRWLGVFFSIAIVSLVITYFLGVKDIIRHPIDYVTYKKPVEIRALVDWLRRSPYRSDDILLTRMTWQSSYLPLYFPEMCSFREYAVAPYAFNFVSPWTKDHMLDDFIGNQKPSLLITCDKDMDIRKRIETILGQAIHESSLVHTEGDIKVYDIRSVVRGGFE